MKEIHHKKAWAILTDQEKNSLLLQLSKGHSSWEAGEIMSITHYKYLELKERSQKFLTMFSNYFELYKVLIRPDCPIDPRFRDYIEGCIGKRLKRREAILSMGDSAMLLPEIKNKHIIQSLERLKLSNNEHDNDLYKLIFEFDRWNNFRILPRSIQQPSAYKRRNNKREKTYIKYISTIPEYKIEYLVDRFWYSSRKKPKYYTVLISEDIWEDGYCVMPIKRTKESIENITKFYMYIFDDPDYADLLGYQIFKFKEKTKGSSLGLRFWEEYRENLKRAINYKEVNNLDFYQDKLDMAYEIKPLKPRKIKAPNIQRADPEIFY